MKITEKIELEAQPRDIKGRQVKTLRKDGILPAVIYGYGMEATAIQVPIKKFEAVYAEAGESTLVYLKVGDKTQPTIINNVDLDPISSKTIHADFYRVRLDKEIIAGVPLHFIGESPAVKNFGGILIKNVHEVEVKALPEKLPNSIEIDISGLTQLEEQILIKDLPVSEGVEIQARQDDIVVLVKTPLSEEELLKSLEGEKADVADVEIETKEGEEEVKEGAKDGAPVEESKSKEESKETKQG
ncbi:MAG: 50S ribosomal protein L25 [Parcubacteria group bacterium]